MTMPFTRPPQGQTRFTRIGVYAQPGYPELDDVLSRLRALTDRHGALLRTGNGQLMAVISRPMTSTCWSHWAATAPCCRGPAWWRPSTRPCWV